MKKLKVLVLMHRDLVPPEDASAIMKTFNPDKDTEPEWITEFDVIQALKKLKHDIYILGVVSDLSKIRLAIEDFKPNIVFNLLEEFDGETLYDQNVVSYLELLKVAYTGSNPRGLMIARDKALTKKILNYHRIKTPKFQVFPKNKKVKPAKFFQYPLIVKCLKEEASLGLAQASVVRSEEKLKERVEYINQKLGLDAIVEEFIEGREFYVGVYGNYLLKTLPVWELRFDKSENPHKELYSRRAKWNVNYRIRKGIKSARAQLEKNLENKINKISKKTYKVLNLSGYARIDMRVDSNGEVYIIEANPNPNIARDDEFATSAKYKKISYPKVIQKILSMGLGWHRIDS